MGGALASLAAKPVITRSNNPGDFLGSHRLAVSRTALDGRWDTARRSYFTGKLSRRAILIAGTGAVISKLEAVNTWTNNHVRYVEDQRLYGQTDYWADPRQTFRTAAGDCEDIALLKMQMLASAGIDRSAMFLVIARDLVRGADHALLIVRDGERFWMLDNSTNQLIDAQAGTADYRPIFSYGHNGKWLHGY